MSRPLHWTLILGCAWLAALYAQPAWVALTTTGVPGAAAVARGVTAEAPLPNDSEPASELLGLVPELNDSDRAPEPLVVGRS